MIGISEQAVGQWEGRVPVGRLEAVERATGVPREQLRPDLFKGMLGIMRAARRAAAA